MSTWTRQEAEIAIPLWQGRKHSAREIAEKLKNKTRNQIISFMRERNIDGGLPLHNRKDAQSYTNKSEPRRLHPGSLGIIEKQTNNLGRITLISIPSLGELAPKAYSYIARDQNFGR